MPNCIGKCWGRGIGIGIEPKVNGYAIYNELALHEADISDHQLNLSFIT